MKVLVTGGAGFIGQHTCRALIKAGHAPVVFDRRKEHADILGDVTDPVAVTEAVAHVDAVIHLAACLGTQETIQNPQPAAVTNVLGSLNVFEAVAQYDVPCVYIAVGNHREFNSYSITKTCAERFATMYNRYRGAHINVVRAMNAYGPGQSAAAPFGPSKVRKIMPAFVCRALSGLPIEVYGDGHQVSDMVYVEDVARILVAALEAPYGQLYEAAATFPTRVVDVAEEVLRHMNPLWALIAHLPMRPGETTGAVVSGDISTLSPLGIGRDDLMPLDRGVKLTVDWFRENEGVTWQRP